jgi:hypothetical protein
VDTGNSCVNRVKVKGEKWVRALDVTAVPGRGLLLGVTGGFGWKQGVT